MSRYTEMLRYNDEQLTRIFGLTKHKFGKILFDEIRQQMREDNPDASEFFDDATAAAKKKSKDAIDKAKNGEVCVFAWPCGVAPRPAPPRPAPTTHTHTLTRPSVCLQLRPRPVLLPAGSD